MIIEMYMIGEILKVSMLVDKTKHGSERCPRDIFDSAVEEIGELSTEVRVKYGKSYKKGDRDGILGESCDVILCLIDLIYKDNPDIKPEDICEVLRFKMSKWLTKESGLQWDNNYTIDT
jgi:NTP pyrophosphatase (non-canonical NTP hydrolase)